MSEGSLYPNNFLSASLLEVRRFYVNKNSTIFGRFVSLQDSWCFQSAGKGLRKENALCQHLVETWIEWFYFYTWLYLLALQVKREVWLDSPRQGLSSFSGNTITGTWNFQPMGKVKLEKATNLSESDLEWTQEELILYSTSIVRQGALFLRSIKAEIPKQL